MKAIFRGMKKPFIAIRKRFSIAMPKFFKWLMAVTGAIATVAIATNEFMIRGGAIPPDWWTTIYPYILGAAGGAMGVCKLTRTYKGVNDGSLKDKDRELLEDCERESKRKRRKRKEP